MGDSFEGVNVELLIHEADRTGSGEVTFTDFVRLLEVKDVTPTSRLRNQVCSSPSFLVNIPA